jgi:anaerobic selenocysteine-containing dehydrogenase
MCHGVCQVLVHIDGDKVVKITGDPDSPTSRGYLCPKGAASPQLLYHPDRITYPLRREGKRGENKWKRVSWDEALDEVAERLSAIKKESGSEYFAMMQGTGRPYTGFTGRFANAFGTPNFTSATHICYFPRVLASVFTLGQLPICDVYGLGGESPACVVVWGCNVTYAGASDGMCGGMVQRAIKSARKVIVVDPRRIDPAEKADHWLRLRPGTDGALALAMINVIIGEGLADTDFVDNYTLGFDLLAEHVREFTPEWAENITRVPSEDIRSAARTYATTKPACIQWGMALDTSPCSFQARGRRPVGSP